MDDLPTALRVTPGTPADLAGRDEGHRLGMADKAEGRQRLADLVERLRTLQRRLWAEDRRSVLLVLQGMDASGKDGTIRRVFGAVNPQGVRVASFREPTHRELDHDFLWRVHRVVPGRGEIGIFNRSHYEDVVTVACLDLVPRERALGRVEHVNAFERLLADEGTTILKVFLHLSHAEQRERLQARIDTPEKHWKFSRGDLEVRRRWDDFMATYEQVLTATSTAWAPWHVVPADHKWVRDVAICELLVDALERMDPQPPPADPDLAGLVVE